LKKLLPISKGRINHLHWPLQAWKARKEYPGCFFLMVASSSDVIQKYMMMTKDAILEGSSQQANKDVITRRNGQGREHLKLFLLVFSK